MNMTVMIDYAFSHSFGFIIGIGAVNQSPVQAFNIRDVTGCNARKGVSRQGAESVLLFYTWRQNTSVPHRSYRKTGRLNARVKETACKRPGLETTGNGNGV